MKIKISGDTPLERLTNFTRGLMAVPKADIVRAERTASKRSTGESDKLLTQFFRRFSHKSATRCASSVVMYSLSCQTAKPPFTSPQQTLRPAGGSVPGKR